MPVMASTMKKRRRGFHDLAHGADVVCGSRGAFGRLDEDAFRVGIRGQSFRQRGGSTTDP